MSRTELDTVGGGSDSNNWDLWFHQEAQDPIADALKAFQDGQVHFGTGRDKDGMFNVLIAPYTRVAGKGNLLRVLVSRRMREAGGQVVNYALSNVVETVAGDDDRAPITRVWQDSSLAQNPTGAAGELPETIYDHATSQPILVTTQHHEGTLANAVDSTPNGTVNESLTHYLDAFSTVAYWHADPTFDETVAVSTH